MVAEVAPNYDSQWAAIIAVALELVLGRRKRCGSECGQAEVDASHPP